jgi:hypothetical protein
MNLADVVWGDVKSPRSASTVGASGIHYGKQPALVLQRQAPRVLRQQAQGG